MIAESIRLIVWVSRVPVELRPDVFKAFDVVVRRPNATRVSRRAGAELVIAWKNIYIAGVTRDRD